MSNTHPFGIASTNLSPWFRKKPGAYTIFCCASGRNYYGSTKDLPSRGRTHFHELRRGRHHNSHLQRAFNRYGEENFVFKVLVVLEESQLSDVEFGLIGSDPQCYNAVKTPWCYGNRTFPTRKGKPGPPRSAETREKIRAFRTGKTFEEIYGDKAAEVRANITRGKTGHRPKNRWKWSEQSYWKRMTAEERRLEVAKRTGKCRTTDV